MSRKRKITNRRSPAKSKSPFASIKQDEIIPITLRNCAQKLEGEEMRELICEVLLSQINWLEYIGSTGLSSEPFFQLYKELLELGHAVEEISKDSLVYLRTFLSDDVKLREAIESAVGLAKLDANEDKANIQEIDFAVIEAQSQSDIPR